LSTASRKIPVRPLLRPIFPRPARVFPRALLDGALCLVRWDSMSLPGAWHQFPPPPWPPHPSRCKRKKKKRELTLLRRCYPRLLRIPVHGARRRTVYGHSLLAKSVFFLVLTDSIVFSFSFVLASFLPYAICALQLRSENTYVLSALYDIRKIRDAS